MLTLPGVIDVHTHLRVPGGEHKEDFDTGTAAALAGGVTLLLAMPNTTPPIATSDVLAATSETAAATARTDVGIFAGASHQHLDTLADLAPQAIGLKIYLNDTFGTLRVDRLTTLLRCFERWPRHKPIAMHAEEQSVAVGIGLAAAYQRPVHFCHISRKVEVELIAAAKARGLPITCEVAPHHLFLTESAVDTLGPLGMMRPPLATQADVDALWAHLDSTIDCIATDHAPHTLAEKESESPPPGVPGVETSLPLMLTAVKQNRLTLDRLVQLMVMNPRQIFNLPPQPETHVEIDTEATHTINHADMHSRCGWTPFDGCQISGRIQRVTLRGQLAYDAARGVIAPPGTGRVVVGGRN